MSERVQLTEDKNPAPGVCLPIIVNFCQHHKVTIRIETLWLITIEHSMA